MAHANSYWGTWQLFIEAKKGLAFLGRLKVGLNRNRSSINSECLKKINLEATFEKAIDTSQIAYIILSAIISYITFDID